MSRVKAACFEIKGQPFYGWFVDGFCLSSIDVPSTFLASCSRPDAIRASSSVLKDIIDGFFCLMVELKII